MTIKLGKNRDLKITFDKDKIKNGYCVYHNNAVKFVESHYYKIIDFFGLRIEYNNYNYDDVMHIILKSTDKFSCSQCSDKVASLQVALKNFVNDEHSLYKVRPPFSFAIEDSFDYENDAKSNDNMYVTYYITVKKQWLIDHGLYGIINPLMRNVFVDKYVKNIHKFPKYNKYKKEVIYL